MNSFPTKLRRGGAAAATSADARLRGGARLASATALSVALAFGLGACGSSSASSPGGSGGSIDLVAYSTPEEAYTKDIEPGFKATPDGGGIEFSNSFGASGDQSRAVEAGQPAGVVHFALEPDMSRLVDDGIVAANWSAGQYKGMVEDSVVVFVVRKGNPDQIQTWDDLTRDGLEVLTPNPFTSGGARWNLMAAYGNQVITEGRSPDQGLQYLSDLLANVPVQDESARDALNTFLGGKGDVLLSYENDAIAAQAAGEQIDYVVPDSTIKIETPLAATESGGATAQKFVDYQYTDEAQQAWADNGYRPVVKSVFDKNRDKFPIPPDLFTIADLGGWDKVSTEFFDPENGSVAAIEQNLGVATQ